MAQRVFLAFVCVTTNKRLNKQFSFVKHKRRQQQNFQLFVMQNDDLSTPFAWQQIEVWHLLVLEGHY
jgi:hypothetical protein